MAGRKTWVIVAWTALLFVLTVACIGLIEFRIAHTGNRMLTFLVWNLFLAWCPLALAFAAWLANRSGASMLVIAPIAAGWLLFFPNAPYLVTDLIHLRISDGRLQLFDAALLSTFGLTGVALGYASLYLVHDIVRERIGPRAAWVMAAGALAAAAVGVYLGRILRLNSWDAVLEPLLLPRLVARRIEDPLGNPDLFLFVGLASVLLLVGYVIVYWTSTQLARPVRQPPRRTSRTMTRTTR